MTHNPYLAPTSRVENQPAAVSVAGRPREVSAAIWLLSGYLALAAPFVSLLLGIRSATLTVVLAVVTLGSLALVVRQISRGRNWARIVMLVFFCLSALASLASLSVSVMLSINALASGDGIAVFMVLATVQLVQVVIGGVAIYFLFTLPGRLWFKRTTRVENQ